MVLTALVAWPQGWIGGWLLPQEASYFALALPHGWWLFGLDLALDHDIDMCQTRCATGPCLLFKVVSQKG